MEVQRVQSLASSAIEDLPTSFVRQERDQPKNSKAIEGIKVPVVSLARPHDAVVDEIKRACSEWGVFLLTDHGVTPELIKRLQEVGKEFFELPQAEKEKYANNHAKWEFEGYGTKVAKNHEQKIEWNDYYFHVMSPPSKVRLEKWPHQPVSYREITEEYNKQMLRLTELLLQLLSEGLGYKENVLFSRLGGDQIELQMKINLYPPCPQPQLALGVEPHADLSGLTILIPNDVPGLEIQKDGNWVAVEYIPNAFFINVGDLVEVLSNGNYRSIIHRSLVNKEKTRMSWAVFSAPPEEAVIGPLPEIVNDQNPAKYATRTFAEFRHRKFNRLPLK